MAFNPAALAGKPLKKWKLKHTAIEEQAKKYAKWKRYAPMVLVVGSVALIVLSIVLCAVTFAGPILLMSVLVAAVIAAIAAHEHPSIKTSLEDYLYRILQWFD